jgi:hypothetical protein
MEDKARLRGTGLLQCLFIYGALIIYLRKIKQVIMFNFKEIRNLFIVTDVAELLDIFHCL